jgi:hypothetical protein
LILKLNRQPLPTMSDAAIERDRKFWTERVDRILGPWLKPETTVQEVADFAEKVYARKDLDGFQGDPRFVRNEYAQKLFSKLRTAIAGVFLWRANQAAARPDVAEQQRMTQAADYAFRQAYALCPSSPEALYRYVNLLVQQQRFDDALALARASSKTGSVMGNLSNLLRELERLKAQSGNAAVSPAPAIAAAKSDVTYRIGFSNVAALAHEHLAAGRTNEALQIADYVLLKSNADAANSDAEKVSLAAQVYQRLNNYPKLEVALKRWVEITPTPEAWLDYAASQAMQNKKDDTIVSLKMALALNHQRLGTNSKAFDIAKELGHDPRFVSLKTHPAFVRLVDANQ